MDQWRRGSDANPLHGGESCADRRCLHGVPAVARGHVDGPAGFDAVSRRRPEDGCVPRRAARAGGRRVSARLSGRCPCAPLDCAGGTVPVVDAVRGIGTSGAPIRLAPFVAPLGGRCRHAARAVRRRSRSHAAAVPGSGPDKRPVVRGAADPDRPTVRRRGIARKISRSKQDAAEACSGPHLCASGSF